MGYVGQSWRHVSAGKKRSFGERLEGQEAGRLSTVVGPRERWVCGEGMP